MDKFIFIATTKKLIQKCLCIASSFVIISVRTGLSLFHQTLLLGWYLYLKVSLTLHYFLNWYRWRSEMYPCTPSIYCLLPAVHVISRCDSVSSFSYTGKIQTFQILKNKQGKLRGCVKCDRLLWISLTFFRKSVCSYLIQYVCYFYDDNKSGSSVNELWYRMFTKKISSRDRLPPTVNALVLHLRFFFIYQKYKI